MPIFYLAFRVEFRKKLVGFLD